MRIRNDISVTKDRKRDRWLVRYYGKYDPTTGKQQRFCKSFKRKKDALSFAESLKQDRDDGISIEPKVISLSAVCDKFLKAHKNDLSYSSQRIYKDTFLRLKNHFPPNTPMRRIKNEDAKGFINSLYVQRKRGSMPKSPVLLADSTRDRHLRNAKRLFNVAKEWGYIRKNPFKGITVGRIKKDNWYHIKPKEFQNVLQAIDQIVPRKRWKREDTERKVRLKGLYGIMYGCGLRFGEAANILVTNGNVDWKNNQIHITNRPGTKNIPAFYIKDYEERSIPAPKWVMELLRECRKLSKDGNPFLFLSKERYEVVRANWQKCVEDGTEEEWCSADLLNNYRRSFEKACKRAGIVTDDRLMVSCCRKSYGTNVANLGTPAHTLQSLMGHSSITTTLKYYVQDSDENQKKAVDGLDRLMEEGE